MNIIKHNLLLLGGGVLRSRGSKILYYHDLAAEIRYTDMATPAEKFIAHVKMIEGEGWEIVSRINKKENQVRICFDDGFRGIWDCRGLFGRFPWRPTVFIAVDLIGGGGYLTGEQILALQEDGFVFQAHGWSHQPLTRFHGRELEHEVSDARKRLGDLLGKEVSELCFPCGAFSGEVLAACRDAGYRMLHSSVPGDYACPLFPGVVRRNLVQFMDAGDVRWVLKGGLGLFSRRYFRRHYQR